ncbi:Protein phosphatase 1L [Goodea atripinnis]|uniref:Protein phosphatase 1L n=1 Tax=Goodea atripinnis TaxID=208336 RepID=A0ABV0MM21_9TELE
MVNGQLTTGGSPPRGYMLEETRRSTASVSLSSVCVCRIMSYFLLRLETLFLLCMSLALWSYFFHMDEVKTIVKSNRDAVKMVKGKVAEMMQNERLGGLDVLDSEFSKTLEFKWNNVAVYSIQSRRDHMEDRFQVLTDIVNKSHPSIFEDF